MGGVEPEIVTSLAEVVIGFAMMGFLFMEILIIVITICIITVSILLTCVLPMLITKIYVSKNKKYIYGIIIIVSIVINYVVYLSIID